MNNVMVWKQKAILIVVALLAMVSPLWAQSEDDFDVRQNQDNTLTITLYKGSEKDVVIPATIYGLQVTSIGESAFSGMYLPRSENRLTSVVIPDTITAIAENAFCYNDLIRVTLGNGLKSIGFGAFRVNSQLKEIIIPDSVTSLGSGAFQKCGLTSVILSRNLKVIEEYVFSENKLTKVILPIGITSIVNSAFSYNEISELTLPDGILSIEGSAFYRNKLTKLTLPASLQKVGWGTFSDNPIEELTILSSIPEIGSPGGFRAFLNNNITRLTIPANMKDYIIGDNFGENLLNFWKNQGKAAGTYVRRGQIWTKEQ